MSENSANGNGGRPDQKPADGKGAIQPDEAKPDENKLIAERRAKLAQVRATAMAAPGEISGGAFPNDFRRDSLAGQLHDAFGERSAQWLEANPARVQLGGRMLFKRVMGKASFAKIAD